MKQVRIMNAFPIFKKLGAYEFPSTVTYELFRMKQELRPVYEFQLEERNKVFLKFKPEYLKETNEFKFKSIEDSVAFQEKFKELDDLEYEMERRPVRIPVRPEYSISGDDMEALDGIVEFYVEEKNEPEPEAAPEETAEGLQDGDLIIVDGDAPDEIEIEGAEQKTE